MMRWWGWGEDGHDKPLSSTADAVMRGEIGELPAARREPVPLDAVELPPATLPPATRERLIELVGTAHLREDHVTRVEHAVGRGYPDLVRLRAGRLDVAPDAVAFPGTPAEVAGLLRLCAAEGVAVVPFGGGTSVVGGVEALRGRFAAVLTVDLRRLDGLLAVDPVALTATFAAGVLGPAAEEALAAHGLTLGHFPQSFEFSTVGGWVATRSAGQASSGYGRIDDLVVALRVATPAGEIVTRAVPASAAGPSVRELLVGSEGAFGIITEVTLRVRPRPAVRRYEGFALPGFAAGTAAFRTLVQAGAAPDVARLSDEQETRVSLALAGDSRSTQALAGYLRARRRANGAIVIAGWEGEAQDVRHRRTATVRILREHGAVALGTRIGHAWEKGRFHAPYLRDELLSRGVLIETLETATSWSRLAELHREVGAAIDGALRGRGTPPIVWCHVSHVYPDGASLYFTFVARQQLGEELAQWHALKAAAGDAILAHGGTITHHHAVGRDHGPWLAREIGELGVELLTATKARLDPEGIMNPGKLVLPAPLPGGPAA